TVIAKFLPVIFLIFFSECRLKFLEEIAISCSPTLWYSFTPKKTKACGSYHSKRLHQPSTSRRQDLHNCICAFGLRYAHRIQNIRFLSFHRCLWHLGFAPPLHRQWPTC